jgi:hypothetical protein
MIAKENGHDGPAGVYRLPAWMAGISNQPAGATMALRA